MEKLIFRAQVFICDELFLHVIETRLLGLVIQSHTNLDFAMKVFCY